MYEKIINQSLELFKTSLPKKGDRLKNPDHVLTEGNSETAPVSKNCLNLLLWI